MNNNRETSAQNFPHVGSEGYFSNEMCLENPKDWTQGTVKEISGNRFTADNDKKYSYFIPLAAFDPMNNWNDAKTNTFQVAFGSRVFLKRNMVVRPVVIETQQEEEKAAQYPELKIGKEYLFTNNPRKGFIRGTLTVLPTERNNYFTANVFRDGKYDDGYYMFCITEEDFIQKRKDMLVCTKPARYKHEIQERPQGQMDNRGLQEGDKVYYTNEAYPQSKEELSVGTFIGASDTSFNVEGSDDVHKVKYIFPAMMIENGDPNWRNFILAIKDGKIFAPHFSQR